ncbi:sigma-70 family RNA polymerase sigma factor [Pedobacter riviphilus]|uniref:Sigma-70 family RNA polymerase sigma factor n=1 Tax=Pedobacter riviphilus TaxID=2766984 RepID=A0ABX6TGI5_9SPHI|nr:MULTISPECIES: sigma-70 family RNA polymerase sigma factor [Pedobacter]NII84208.1 RNA polymerase sigma-70 factor (ECF subfamily) [Pedobacter sp. SG908]NMN38877.1 RNA polymerase sigma-70 factor (ECF subfamily) [Pedobacter sp. SG918]QNR84056.1 sigma-70 family RNA polymerase sigma factor [Pedobacter riviphilus]
MSFDKLIFSIAYDMTGDYETSKDVVQDINLKFLESPIAEIVADKRNYVIRTTINHCLNLKKREQRLAYTGSWLPEPIVSGREQTIHHSKFEEHNSLCYELIFLLEQLSLTERAVFVLREAFDFDHKEIAEAINISSANSRQLFKRAKEKVANLKHNSISDATSIAVAKKFVSLISNGEIEELIAIFNDNISIIGDGGGKAPAIAKPIFGKQAVAQFMVKLFSNKNYSPTFSFTEILSQPAIVIYINGEIICVQVLSLQENKISQVFAVINPDKLTHFDNDFKFVVT